MQRIAFPPSIEVESKTRGARQKVLALQDQVRPTSWKKSGVGVPATVRTSHSCSPPALSLSACFKFETRFDLGRKLFMLNRN